MVSYAVQLVTRYDGLVIATFPDLPGVSALGRDDEEACEEAHRALVAALAGYQEAGLPAPKPRTQSKSMISADLMVPAPAAVGA